MGDFKISVANESVSLVQEKIPNFNLKCITIGEWRENHLTIRNEHLLNLINIVKEENSIAGGSKEISWQLSFRIFIVCFQGLERTHPIPEPSNGRDVKSSLEFIDMDISSFFFDLSLFYTLVMNIDSKEHAIGICD